MFFHNCLPDSRNSKLYKRVQIGIENHSQQSEAKNILILRNYLWTRLFTWTISFQSPLVRTHINMFVDEDKDE